MINYNAPPVLSRVDNTINYATNGNGWTSNAGTGTMATLPTTVNAAGSGGGLGLQIDEVAGQWTGTLNIVTGGSYAFSVVTDDGATLYIDGNVVFNITGTSNPTTAAVTLAAGPHTFQNLWYQGSGAAQPLPVTRGRTPAAPRSSSRQPPRSPAPACCPASRTRSTPSAPPIR